MKKRNVKLVLLVQIVPLVIAFMICKISSMGIHTKSFQYFMDFPSIVGLLLFVVPGMFVLGVWKDFWKALSIGQKEYKLIELKNILEAVKACQKLVLLGGIFEVIIGFVAMLFDMEDFRTIGPALCVMIMPVFYVVISEYFLLTLSVFTQKAINEEMNLDEEE